MAKVFVHDQTNKNIAPKQANAKLTVYCLSGSVVHAVSDDVVRTVVANENGKAVFTGLFQGHWTITAQNGNSTATQSVDIVTDYEITMKYFEATLNITYPSGSVCVCSDGITTFTAPDTSGTWTCTIPGAGSWTISCSKGSQSKEQSVDVSYEGQIVDVKVAYFEAIINVVYPNGAICSCADEASIFSASDTSGTWSFVVPNVGVWTITATDGVQTVSQIVTITANGQVENVTIKFFGSTINVTYPSGATCTCTDGISTFVAPNTSGNWSVTVPRLGTWIIKAYDSSNTTTTTVNITADGQSINITCKFFISYIKVTYPAGSFKVILWYSDPVLGKVEMAADTSSSGSISFVVRQAGEYHVGAYRVAPYVGIETTAGDYDTKSTNITASGQTKSITLSYNTIPKFTYSGKYKIVDDSGGTITQSKDNWNIMFTTSGIFKMTTANGAKNGIDVFCLGGGGNGGNTISGLSGGYLFSAAGGGGGGGYRTNSFKVKINEGSSYEIVIGSGGGQSSAFGSSANAGGNGGDGRDFGSNDGGGAGGTGGSNGSAGGVNATSPSAGANGSYPFLLTKGVRYGPGGAGGYAYNGKTNGTGRPADGGKDGGGNSNSNASANSGGGGGGASYKSSGSVSAGKGGSGIVIIRNTR